MSARTGFIYHERFLAHDTGQGHPERPERLSRLVEHLHKANLWNRLQHPLIDAADEEWIMNVHTPAHVAYLREACRRGVQILDQGDTHACMESFEVALLAAGGVLGAVDAVVGGLLENAFCAVRPPGHHAGRESVMGFCLLNNVAIAARYAQKRHGVGRVAIVDWDVHHGNGTQEIFYEDRSVLYVSTHQYPFYPGTGARSECGEGDGEGTTLNIPMRAGSGEKEYFAGFTNDIIPAIDHFRPDLLLLSAGFDAHRDDPLANITLTEESFGTLTRMMGEAAAKHCGGRIVSVLEGGYNLEALSRSVEAHLRVLLAAGS